MSLLTTKQIMEIIPHRQPFLLVDTIEELTPGLRAVLTLELEIIKEKGPIGIGRGTAKVGGKLAASAELTFAIGSGE